MQYDRPKPGWRFSIRPGVRVLALALAAVAGALVLAGILYDSGIHPGWLERFHSEWIISSDGLAEQAYRQFLSGKRSEGLALFELALRRDPASPYRWCDYGEALLQVGNRAGASRAIQRGVELGPQIASIRMRAVNFAYRTGDATSAMKQGRILLDITGSYDADVFRVWDRLELSADVALRSSIPNRRTGQSYLRHLMATGNAGGARQTWIWLLARSFIDDKLADEYVAFLLRQRDYRAAAAAWTAYIAGRDPGYPDQNAIFNGSFEREPAGTAFDWYLGSASGVRIERDSSVAAAGRFSLRLGFDGTENIAFAHVYQRAVVDARHWMFQARIRTDGITTDEGIRFHIFDAEAPQRLDVRTGALSGTQDWTSITANFIVTPVTHLIEIRTERNPSLKLDSKIHGTAWVDAVVLLPGPK
jgi:hypothetical protein